MIGRTEGIKHPLVEMATKHLSDEEWDLYAETERLVNQPFDLGSLAVRKSRSNGSSGVSVVTSW